MLDMRSFIEHVNSSYKSSPPFYSFAICKACIGRIFDITVGPWLFKLKETKDESLLKTSHVWKHSIAEVLSKYI